MAFKINEDCISCGACASECPVSCISKGEERFVIDAEQCIECGACGDICPVSAANQE
ncbi:MAG: 4Fe-4S binding protein [Clostridiales bacterium]|jgi:ferredoxin|nr:4Fe-4S binding protein [Clostridiales bacterium]